jgi:TolB-like protein/DNA-binding SARP family transcriptional activator
MEIPVKIASKPVKMHFGVTSRINLRTSERKIGRTGMSKGARLNVVLLGGFAVNGADGSPIALSGKKNQALLAYLAVNAGVRQSREHLAGLLWSDRFEDQARQSLRQAISRLRKDLGDETGELLVSDADGIVLEREGLTVDADLFEQLAKDASTASLERAVGLYGGPFLKELRQKDQAFEEWIEIRRRYYEEMFASVLGTLSRLQAEQGHVAAAIASARRLIELDPTQEQGHRDLMRLLATDGQRAQALKQYRACADCLKKELGVEPEASTRKLYEEIRASEAILPMTQQAADSGPPTAAPLPLPEGPSIAVLPFVNLSGDPEQDYFSDGISDDLITALSNVRSFLVIARNSSFAFKDRSVNVKEIARELGVRYVLEGTVRKAGDRIRVSAQLVEAVADTHIWADRYDGTLDDIFDLQDKIVESVVGALEPQVHRAEFERIKQKRPDSFDAYDLTLLGLAKMNRLTAKDNEEALQYFVAAIEIDPSYARAHVCASYCYRRQVQLMGRMLPERTFEESIRLAREGLRIDPTDPYVLWQSALTFALVGRDFDEALALVKRSLSINSSSNRAWIASGMVHCYVGRPEQAIEHAERAMRLSPLDVSMWVACWVMATGFLQLERYEEAANWARKSLRRHPENLSAKYVLAASLAHADQLKEAKAVVAELLEHDAEMTISRFRVAHQVARYRNLEGFLEGLRKAGLPEG